VEISTFFFFLWNNYKAAATIAALRGVPRCYGSDQADGAKFDPAFYFIDSTIHPPDSVLALLSP